MIIDILCVLNEKIKKLDISEDDLLRVTDKDAYIHLFSNVKDFRQSSKITYKLENILLLVLLCIFEMGKVSYLAIADRIYTRRKDFKKMGLIKDIDKLPSHDTIRRILSNLDSDSLFSETLNGFYNFLKSLEKNIKKDYEYNHTGIDGKEMCGSGRSKDSLRPKSNLGHLNILDTGTMTCLVSASLDKKESEIIKAQDLLKEMDLKRKIVTADALHCQKETARIISERKGRYVLCAKDNQSLLKDEIISRFNKYHFSSYKEDTRIIDIYHLPKNYSCDGFSDMKTFIRLINHKKKREVTRYFISNSNDDELIKEAILLRWSIENDLHKVKDTFLGEDLFHGTDKKANQNIALLNNIAIQLIYIYKAISDKELRRCKDEFRVYPLDTINCILSFMASSELIDKIVSELKKDKRRGRK